MHVNGYRLIGNNWQNQNLMEHYNGRAFIARDPGVFAFAGRVVVIPGVRDVPHGGAMTGIVARYGLEDLFGMHPDLDQNATRLMVVGSVARMAGMPSHADPMAWAAANLNVTLSARNASGLVSRQEAIAIVMALYEQRTNTRINSIAIRNFQHTQGMTLDSRYAQAVRVAFELGLITDNTLNPQGAVSIGEFLHWLAVLSARV
jgi:hypothetical protein